jgi:hypothetical protein
MDITYTVIRNGVRQNWKIRFMDGKMHVYDAHDHRVLFYRVDEDDSEDYGKLNWKVVDDLSADISIPYQVSFTSVRAFDGLLQFL